MCGTNTTHLGVGVGGCGVDVLHTISKLRSSCTLVEPACRGQSVPEQLGTGPIPQTALWAYKANLVKIYIAFT